jgi:hypothetical protein
MCNLGQRRPARQKYAVVTVTDRAACRKLALQIERDLVAHRHLTTMLADAAATMSEHRRELRNLKARMARDKSK